MYEQEDADDFYLAGRKLAAHIAYFKEKDISVATLQALIRDLLPEHEELQEALRSIVARPGFLQLVQLAGSEKGVAQKCVFTESLRKIYSAETVSAAESLVCGMIGLGVTTAEHESALKKIFIDTVAQQVKDNGVQVEIQGANSTEKRYGQGKSREIAKIHSPVATQQSSKRMKFLFLVMKYCIFTFIVAFAAFFRLPKAKVVSNLSTTPTDYSTRDRIPPSLGNLDLCRATQDIRFPSSTYGEYTKPLKDGLGRFAPPGNTKEAETWLKYSCSEIPGIYDWEAN
ncbi:hypothetical protein [Synechococcus lacustris]|uniref:hypothetical protein n=1 Tax=Synechococcus lacustris TaxID=2116544 RepID=UPI0020CFC3CB|nr:hypothetical protein [Synechococcus lacustris]